MVPVLALKQGAEPSRHARTLRLAGQPHESAADDALEKMGMAMANSVREALAVWAAQQPQQQSRRGEERARGRRVPEHALLRDGRTGRKEEVACGELCA